MFCHRECGQNIMVEIYLTRNTSLQTQHRNNEAIDFQRNQAVQARVAG